MHSKIYEVLKNMSPWKISKEHAIGYSPMQEQYAHTPYDKVRTDFMQKALAGNAAIFLKVTETGKDAFELLEW